MNAKFKKLAQHFRALEAEVPLKPIRNHEDYGRAVAALNALLDAGAANEEHPLANLAATLGELIGDFDDRHYPVADVGGVAMLSFLMEQHKLRQCDLPEIGTQSVVSEIINGKREINLRQVRGLKERFGVSADAFV